MDGAKKIQIVLVENEESGLLVEDSLRDFTEMNETGLLVFHDEKSLINHLKSNKNKLKDSVTNIIIFNISPPLNEVIEIIKSIKSNPDISFVPVFVISTSVDDEEISELYKAYANAYVAKPDDLRGLLMLLDKFRTFWEYTELP